MQDQSTFNKQQPYMIPTRGLRSLQSIMENSQLRLRDTSFKIDRGGIVDHYQKLRQQQRQALAFINMPRQRKKQLFGIFQSSKQHYAQSPQLVIQQHPIDGKIILTKQKWLNKLQNLKDNIDDFGQTQQDGINKITKNYFVKKKDNQVRSQNINIVKNKKQTEKVKNQRLQQNDESDFCTPQQIKNGDVQQLNTHKEMEYQNIFENENKNKFKYVNKNQIQQVSKDFSLDNQ